ncbi:hypothetical protein SAMD00020551_0888 [Mesobacillus selenatarsenatis SF-1]|uniref:Uncharacterized protein n=1 Tax=Mesobacillus selenatarsenatis (strain DSM 18680 / JCM 14380 / FERM P-15431 / SF-1) TaxID=1321606 RepID=A0A0A8WYL5_MESS1|nr:hypothetical protein SAMD00020551_0888 [Mesobacillus selenatarsenatis SF-1]
MRIGSVVIIWVIVLSHWCSLLKSIFPSFKFTFIYVNGEIDLFTLGYK